MNHLFNKKDIENATVDYKELDGMKVTLQYLGNENVSILSGISEDGKVYILRLDEHRPIK